MEFPKNFVCATADRSTYSHHVPAPMFRKAFVLHNAPASAQLRICGLGFYRLFVNGQEITRSLLAPYISNPDHALYYDDYDLTAHLTAGENVIGVLLGNGMGNPMITSWGCMNAPFSDAPKMATRKARTLADAEDWMSFVEKYPQAVMNTNIGVVKIHV